MGSAERSTIVARPAPGSREALSQELGEQPPLLGGDGQRPPDRRRVSVRWMTGSVLTGMTSLLLMGGALYAAMDGRQQMAQPASTVGPLVNQNGANSKAIKGDRTVAIVALEPVNERIMQVPTVTRVGNSNVIRKRPFAYGSAPLAVVPGQRLDYPPFNPLSVFRTSETDTAIASSDVIYSADIESEVLIQQEDFPLAAARYDESTRISAPEAEQIVRNASESLENGAIQVAALPYLDPSRFVLDQKEVEPPTALDFRIVEENVSHFPVQEEIAEGERHFSEEVLVPKPNQTLKDALSGLGLTGEITEHMVNDLITELGDGPLQSGTRLRVAWEDKGDGEGKLARRISVYRAGTHLNSIAANDDDSIVWANEPAAIPATQGRDPSRRTRLETVARTNLPNVYDGLHRAVFSQGLTKDHARRIVRTVAFDVDFRNRITPEDDLEIFYSLPEGEEEATAESEILYVGLTLSGVKRSYYRFRAPDDDSVDYYDEDGKSAKKFLLRKPVPNGRFRSPFGMRRHPISRTYKMHSGVDFSAPRGTRIIAAGNGVVEKAGWHGGCGKRTVIRHANGYKTTYCHQNRIARGVRPGARVTQGQIIGQVGSTGYSTGPHLHYEVSVNGRKVNPMKIRLPQGRVLKGVALAAFKRERNRIDALLDKGRGPQNQTLAALN